MSKRSIAVTIRARSENSRRATRPARGPLGSDSLLPRFLFRGIAQIKVADLVVDGARVPHAALRIEEELPHRDLRMRIGIFRHFAAARIEPPEGVLLVR